MDDDNATPRTMKESEKRQSRSLPSCKTGVAWIGAPGYMVRKGFAFLWRTCVFESSEHGLNNDRPPNDDKTKKGPVGVTRKRAGRERTDSFVLVLDGRRRWNDVAQIF